MKADFGALPRDTDTIPASCLATGTLIRASCGDVAIEALRVGDRVMTATGHYRPVRWLSHRTVAFRDRGTETWPVRIAAHALGTDLPSQDVLVAPRLAIAIDLFGAVLVPAANLINGSSFARVALDEITFWHVGLDESDLLLASGLPFESHIEDDEHVFFAEHGVEPSTPPLQRLPFAVAELVDVFRNRIAGRAEAIGWRRDEPVFAGLCIQADGRICARVESGLTARFNLPPGARDLWLISEATVPALSAIGPADPRRLGVCLVALMIEDQSQRLSVPLDHVLLTEGFHDVEDQGRRWTTGRAHLPAALLAGCEGEIVIEVRLAGPALFRWIAPSPSQTSHQNVSVHSWCYNGFDPSILEQSAREGVFISYAQNFEDVMLWRALHSVERGFYVDVGACSPIVDSVTAAFYQRGWSGINIEPIAELHSQLMLRRPRDINLRLCAGASFREATLNVVRDTGLSTMNGIFAKLHQEAGKTLDETTITVQPLAAICREYVRSPIHFLKIDAEGAEREVLLGADFALFRPWIVLLEATLPNSQKVVHKDWEYLLLAADYHFVWFDGLNRFYVAAEHHAELSHAFVAPINVFDNVQLSPAHTFLS